MGKFFVGVVFDGEFVLINYYDKMQGIFIILRGVGLYFYMITLKIKKYLEIYYIEIGYLNWAFGDFFRKNGFSILVLRE